MEKTFFVWFDGTGAAAKRHDKLLEQRQEREGNGSRQSAETLFCHRTSMIRRLSASGPVVLRMVLRRMKRLRFSVPHHFGDPTKRKPTVLVTSDGAQTNTPTGIPLHVPNSLSNRSSENNTDSDKKQEEKCTRDCIRRTMIRELLSVSHSFFFIHD